MYSLSIPLSILLFLQYLSFFPLSLAFFHLPLSFLLSLSLSLPVIINKLSCLSLFLFLFQSFSLLTNSFFRLSHSFLSLSFSPLVLHRTPWSTRNFRILYFCKLPWNGPPDTNTNKPQTIQHIVAKQFILVTPSSKYTANTGSWSQYLSPSLSLTFLSILSKASLCNQNELNLLGHQYK